MASNALKLAAQRVLRRALKWGREYAQARITREYKYVNKAERELHRAVDNYAEIRKRDRFKQRAVTKTVKRWRGVAVP